MKEDPRFDYSDGPLHDEYYPNCTASPTSVTVSLRVEHIVDMSPNVLQRQYPTEMVGTYIIMMKVPRTQNWITLESFNTLEDVVAWFRVVCLPYPGVNTIFMPKGR